MSQKTKILNLLIDREWVCNTELMAAYIPDYRRRITDLKQDGYILSGRPCQQHDHKSKNLKEWHFISSPADRIVATSIKLPQIEAITFFEGNAKDVNLSYLKDNPSHNLEPILAQATLL